MTQQKDMNKKGSTLGGGGSQFTMQKAKMVNDFMASKDMSDNRPTQTDKGKYAEALFREWLEQFLPAKYGVTSGYIISQRDSLIPTSALKGKLCHYDVIIYNRLESPVHHPSCHSILLQSRFPGAADVVLLDGKPQTRCYYTSSPLRGKSDTYAATPAPPLRADAQAVIAGSGADGIGLGF